MTQEAVTRAAFLLIAMTLSGAVHVLWLRSSTSQQFTWPVDAGCTFRGHRLFGDNKRVCGFMVLPPATALFFMLLGGSRELLPTVVASALWPLAPWQYAGLGFVCGLAFMLAELPNSFIKRQLGIAPGEVPDSPMLKSIIMLVDRYDSVLGVLIALSLLVPVPLLTWILVLLLGPVLHGLFSIVLKSLGLKARAL